MFLRVSFLAVATVAAAAAVNQRKRNSSVKHKVIDTDLEKDGSGFERTEQEEEEEKKFPDNLTAGEEQEEEAAATINTEMEKMKPNSPRKTGYGEMEFSIQEKKLSYLNYQIDLFRNLVKEIEQRRMNLETKLLELHRLKEQKSCITELQRKLEDKMAEKNKLYVKLNLLQEERNDLQNEIKEGILAKEQLEKAKTKVEKMKRKLDANLNHTKGHLMMLQEKLSGFQSDQLCCTNAFVEEKHKAVKYFELQIFEMKRKNKELELQKRELAVQLNAAQARMTTLSNCTESKTKAKAGEEIRTLKQSNQDLSNQVERLQQNRFEIIEELVYQRWLNTCLRFEIQDHESLSRKFPKHDSDTNSNQKSHEQCKRSILNPNFDRFSSHSSSTESDKNDSCTSRSSLSASEKSSLIMCSGGSPWSRKGLIGRLSSLMVPSMPCGTSDSANNTPTKKKKIVDLTKSLETPSPPRARRVSFSDFVRTDASTLQDTPNKVEEVLQNKEMRYDIKPSTKTSAELVGEKRQLSSPETNVVESNSCIDAIEQPAKRDDVDIKMDKTRIGSEHSEELHSKTHMVLARENYKVEMNRVLLIAVLFLFCFIVLGYFLLLTAGIPKA